MLQFKFMDTAKESTMFRAGRTMSAEQQERMELIREAIADGKSQRDIIKELHISSKT